MAGSVRARTFAVLLCVVAASLPGTSVCAASGSAADSARSRWLCPARFAPLPRGWVEGSLGPQPTTTTTDAWAHNRGFANLNDIPRDGIYVWVLLGVRGPSSPAPSARRPLRLPFDIRHPDQIATAEGPPLPEYRFAGRYHGLYVDVRVDFGRTGPPLAMRRGAEPVLRALRLPSAVVGAAAACR